MAMYQFQTAIKVGYLLFYDEVKTSKSHSRSAIGMMQNTYQLFMTLSAEERREQPAPLLNMMMVIIQRCPGDSHVVLKSEDY